VLEEKIKRLEAPIPKTSRKDGVSQAYLQFNTQSKISQLPEGDLRTAMQQIFDWGMCDFDYDTILAWCQKYSNNCNLILDNICE
jgi:hypothetical protein